MNDLEWLFHVKISFRPALLESERLNVKKIIQPLRFRGVLCIARSVSQHLTNILRAVVVTHWNVRALPELGLECAALRPAGQRPANVLA